MVQASVKPISRHIPIFANVPGYEQATDYDRKAGYDINRPPSNPAKSPTSPPRPQTADAIVGRRRSKTAPSQPSFEPSDSWVDKPLPLVVDSSRKKSLPGDSEGSRKQPSDIGDRPKTSSGTSKQSALAGKRNQSETNLSRRPSGPVYSLTPSIVTSPTSTKPHQRIGSTTSTRSTVTGNSESQSGTIRTRW